MKWWHRDARLIDDVLLLAGFEAMLTMQRHAAGGFTGEIHDD
ncbi:MAG: hypothetical protein WD208_11675 [Dehalococcoidia bacterium]